MVILLVLGALLLTVLQTPTAAGEPSSYTIYRAGVPLKIDGRLDETAWIAAPDVGKFHFPWWKAGKQEQTIAKLLWDDDHHSYDYVVSLVRALFGYTTERGFVMACEVDTSGRVIVLTTTREHAELKRDQIHAFGKDDDINNCKGSMTASIEPVPTD